MHFALLWIWLRAQFTRDHPILVPQLPFHEAASDPALLRPHVLPCLEDGELDDDRPERQLEEVLRFQCDGISFFTPEICVCGRCPNRNHLMALWSLNSPVSSSF